MMKINIRAAAPGDEQVVVALIHELAETDGDISPLTQDYLAVYWRNPGSRILLAEIDGQAAGLLSYSIRPDLYHAGASAYIENLVVAKDQRGVGIGSALLKAALAEIEAAGCVEVSIATMPENQGAQRLYRSHGLTDEAVYLEKHFSTGLPGEI
jgi:ribosomal protein S18 acetylase RimI-like enzyme